MFSAHMVVSQKVYASICLATNFWGSLLLMLMNIFKIF